ncbi:MAG: hypothetical protein RDU59_04095 [Thermodesulfobacteriota bacterium]|nr:hypothetical protein [Thermodesulfobacteriota bacterium]
MRDVTGKLPVKGKWRELHIGGNKYGSFTNDFSMDELWIFNSPDDSPEQYGLRP